MNFYPFHPGDYMLRTAHLEPIEDLAYRRLLDLYYVNEGPIEGDAEAIARVIRMRANAEEVKAVLDEFFTFDGSVWRHSHCDQVVAQYQAKAEQAVKNGRLGGRPRKADSNQEETQEEPEANPAETQSVNSANPAETGSKANQEPITKTKEEEHVDAHASTQVELIRFEPEHTAQLLELDRTPYERIRELYNTILGGKLKRCMGLNDTHRKHIRAAYNLKLDGKFIVRDGGLEFWEGLFHDVLECPFMLGNNNRGWRADFEFLTTSTKIQKFLEGKYDNVA